MGARRSVVGLLPVVLVAAIAGCAFTPQPTVTRLPPAASGATAAPTVTIPSPSVVPASPPATSAPVVSSTPSDVPVTGDVVVCAEGESRSISGSEQSVRVEGSCAQLSVSGNALTVDATAARIGSLAIAGDRVRVDAAEIERLSVQGNDATVTSAGTIGSVDLSGDRTRVTAAGAISSAAVRGQDNTVSAGGGVGDSVIEGRGNQVG